MLDLLINKMLSSQRPTLNISVFYVYVYNNL